MLSDWDGAMVRARADAFVKWQNLFVVSETNRKINFNVIMVLNLERMILFIRHLPINAHSSTVDVARQHFIWF